MDSNNNITPNDIFNAQVPTATPEEQKPVVQQAPQPAPVEMPKPEVKVETPTLQYKLLSPWAYIGYNLLFGLPIIGFILLIVYAVDKDTYNVNRRNYARSFLYIWLIMIGLMIIMFLIFGAALFAGLTDAAKTTGQSL